MADALSREAGALREALSRDRILLLAIAVFPLLTACFYTRIGIGSRENLQWWPAAGEPKIYGRLAKSRQDGVFSAGGMLGACGEKKVSQNVEFQKGLFEQGKCDDFVPYKSQIGGQGFLYYVVNSFYDDPGFFRFFASVTTAAGLAVLLFWIGEEFGAGAFLAVALSLFSYRGLVIFGSNIAQVLGFDFLVPASLFWAYRRNWKNIGRITFGVLFLKYVINGFEYFFPIWVSAFIPLAYYAVRDGYDKARVRRDALAIAKAIALATALAGAILIVQISFAFSLATAGKHFLDRVQSRTYLPTDNNVPFYFKYMNWSVWDLVRAFLGFDAIHFKTWGVTFLKMNVLIAVSSACLRLRHLRGERKLLALCVATWLGAVGAYGWILLFKGHSAPHFFSDPLVFFMPFLPLGVAFIYVLIETSIKKARHLRP